MLLIKLWVSDIKNNYKFDLFKSVGKQQEQQLNELHTCN